MLTVTLWTVTHKDPLSMWFFKQEYWRGLPLPPQGDLMTQGQTRVSYVSCIDRWVLYH